MSAGDLFAAAHVERGDGFAMQATTHWLRLVPGRTLFGLKAGGLPVELPDLPNGVRHPGLEATTEGHRIALIDVSSHWLRDNPDVLTRYAANLRGVLANKAARMDGYAKHVAVNGSIELFLGRELDRVPLEIEAGDGFYEVAIDLLANAPRDSRTAFAMPRGVGSSKYDDPDFFAGTQSWIDGERLLVEFRPEEGGRQETLAVDRRQFLGALERCWGAVRSVSDRLRASLPDFS
ncbi:hypothetical protein [Luteibacter sp.]|uniref:hypothetical protein n=1 Tax=Luteibacter sp. TaxID=1886636 RepID=UPI003F81197A